ncbi:hypothetical protein BJ138DRAFT_650250 [Hygrophoropsis aurantiaca]|uniref:Uncharacterized protein n=1 Tax=Hygrophoropsis aurantiaca TaxID=72124 RepID=A0ACB7ZZ45_9AGAM|nr:hypothetical protein BJ138DRAFT_650250 [Hygrophoropsis aurantiaca]
MAKLSPTTHTHNAHLPTPKVSNTPSPRASPRQDGLMTCAGVYRIFLEWHCPLRMYKTLTWHPPFIPYTAWTSNVLPFSALSCLLVLDRKDRARALLSGTGAGAGCTFHALLADVGGRGGGDGGIGADSGGRVPIPRDIEKEVLAEISVYVRDQFEK